MIESFFCKLTQNKYDHSSLSEAWTAPISAAMLVSTRMSTLIPASSIARITPRCASPRAEPQQSANSNSKSKRHLCWLVFLLLNVLPVRLRRLDPRRLDVIFDLKPE
jgi:hypothetical protein